MPDNTTVWEGAGLKAFWAKKLKMLLEKWEGHGSVTGEWLLSPEEAEGRCLAGHSATAAQAGHSCQAKGTVEGMLIINSAVLS